MLLLCVIVLAAILLAAGTGRADSTPPGPLYTYHRTDQDATRVRIGAPRPAPRIDPRIFSNFLEHLGGTIYEALWANVVYNPQFEADSQGRLVRWSRSGGAEWSKEGLCGRSMRLPAGAYASQLLTLPIHRERRYTGSLWARTYGERHAELEVALLRRDKPSTVVRTRLRIESPEWRSQPFSFLVPEHAIERAETVELRLTVTDGDAGIDMVEVFPADAVDGADPDVVKAARDLHIELLRWPGGNFVSGYHWRNGVGPREKRPTVPNPAWSGLETHHFGTDEFMRFCGHIGAKPQISVNAGNGTPEEAAAWVEYCNGSAETPMGRLRAANGHPEPYHVRVWEIGNELYGDWQIGHTDPAGNAARFVRFRDAMLAVDPTIEIIATGKGDEFVGAGLSGDRAWNEAILDAAKSSARPPDYLSLHPLVPLPQNLPARYSYDEIFQSVMAHPQWWSDSFLPNLHVLIQSRFGPNARTHAAATEWGIILGGPNWLRYPNHDAKSGAVYAASFFHAMFRAAGFVSISNVTALMHGGGIKKWSSVVFFDPMYYVERMYGTARPDRLLPTDVSGPGYDVPQRGFLPAVQDVPYLDILAAAGKDLRYVFVVNRDPHKPRRAEFTLPTKTRSATVETQMADPQQRNSLENPRAVAPTRSTLEIGGASFEYAFPPCSVTLFTLSSRDAAK